MYLLVTLNADGRAKLFTRWNNLRCSQLAWKLILARIKSQQWFVKRLKIMLTKLTIHRKMMEVFYWKRRRSLSDRKSFWNANRKEKREREKKAAVRRVDLFWIFQVIEC